MIKVCHLITELSTGGAQRALLALLQHSDQDRFGHIVTCLYNGSAEVALAIRSSGIVVFDLEMTARWRWDSFGRLYRLLQRERPDILHTWMFHANLSGRVIGYMCGVPIVITSRRNIDIGGAWREFAIRVTSSLDDRVIAASEAVRLAQIHHTPRRTEEVVTIQNGIDTEPYEAVSPKQGLATRRSFGISESAPLVGTVGRLHPQKGYPDLLKAMRQICDLTPAARLLIVGDGELRSSLEEISRSIGLENAVVFAGLRSDIPELLAALDVFVLSSRWEGMPNVVLEAMAAGLPVVATAVGGTPEVVVHGETGLLVPARDPQALARAMKVLLDDPERARAMGRSGKERVARHFDIRETVRITESLYEELLREKGIMQEAE